MESEGCLQLKFEKRCKVCPSGENHSSALGQSAEGSGSLGYGQLATNDYGHRVIEVTLVQLIKNALGYYNCALFMVSCYEIQSG
ncbi:TPA: hypothetical protein L6A02_24715 [Pseudomonas aeruginosa]|nr:hypothetical protein [Pseudomonas aeruginosa]